MLHRFFEAILHPVSYRYGLPFITSVALAALTISRCQPSLATSIWTFALLALISTAFTLLCGGPFRTFFIAIAVTPPFLFLLRFFLPSPYFPSRGLGEYFLYFVGLRSFAFGLFPWRSIADNDTRDSALQNE